MSAQKRQRPYDPDDDRPDDDRPDDELDDGEVDDDEVDDREPAAARPVTRAPAEPYGDEDTEGTGELTGDPDVLLDVPLLKVEEIHLDVEDLHARVSLQADVLDLLKLHVGADVELGRVELDIKGVDAQALLKVRLDRVAAIVSRVLTTIDRNPQLLEPLTASLGEAVGDIGYGAGTAVHDVGQGAGTAVGEVGRGARTAVGEVGRGARTAVGEVGRGARTAVGEVGQGTGETVGEVGRGATRSVNKVGRNAGRAARDVGRSTSGAVEDVWDTAGEVADRGTTRAGDEYDENDEPYDEDGYADAGRGGGRPGRRQRLREGRRSQGRRPP